VANTLPAAFAGLGDIIPFTKLVVTSF